MHRSLLAVLIVAMVAAFLAGASAASRAAAAFTPTFEDAACPMPLPQGQLAHNVRCGYLTVQETHGNDDGRTLKLAVAILKSTAAKPEPDPVVYLTGGPGAPALEGEFQGLGEATTAAFIQSKRDFIFFDQRGTGHSQPALNCPETAHVLLDSLAANRTPAEQRAANDEALLDCHDRLVAEGVNLNAYNSRESAYDIADLMSALGYDEYNLFGTSYGPRLELTAMREVPQRIRSVILDSPLAVNANGPVDQAADLQRSLNEVFHACSSDRACHTAYPDFEQQFWEVVRRANEHPIEVQIKDADGKPIDIKISGGQILNGVFVALYNNSTISVLPLATDQIYKGNYGIVALLAQQIVFAFSDEAAAMTTSVNCSEEIPFLTADVLKSATAGVRQEIVDAEVGITNEAGRLDELALCKAWGAPPPSAIENQAVVSDIPTMIFDGQFDPITPPRYGQLAAEKLFRNYVFQFPTSGHGVTYQQYDCASSMIAAFLADPETRPNASCIAGIGPLEFAIGDQATPAPPPATPAATPAGVSPPETGARETPPPPARFNVETLALLAIGACSMLLGAVFTRRRSR
jgi:pimeloyl-ACP methyl ester carboxylesterase